MSAARRRVALAPALAAALLATGAAPARAHAQSNAALAQQPFERGVALYDAGQFEQALAQFRAALALYESPNIVLYIARSLRGMGRLAEAVLAFERAARAAGELAAREPRYADTRDAARDELRAIEPRVARLTVVARALPPEARVVVGGQPVPAAAAHELTVPVDPGAVEIVAQAPGFAVERQTVTLAAGARTTVTVALTRRVFAPQHGAPSSGVRSRVVEAPRPVRTSVDPGWLALGVTTGVIGVGGFVVAGVFWSFALAQFHVVEAECPMPPCPASYRPTIATGRTDTLATNVGLGVGIGATALSVVFVALALRNAGSPRVRAAVAPNGALVLGGVF